MANTGAGFGDENYESFGLEPLTANGTFKKNYPTHHILELPA
jgi:hypothetical protein